MNKNSKIYIAGHKGMVGSAIRRNLDKKGFEHLVLRSSDELDLRDQKSVRKFFEEEEPEYVFLAAAKVGGIMANNTFRGEFLYDNLMIQNNVIHSAYEFGTKKLMFLGSSCIYPKMASQPLKEESLLTGKLEPTNEPYAIAKIAGIKMCESYKLQYGSDFISVMPTNLYGYGDNYHLENSHVLPAMIRKFYEAKLKNEDVTLWGTGTPKREFLFSDDLAEACVFLMDNYSDHEFINVGVGEDVSIKELAELVKQVVGYDGKIIWDKTKPDGTPRKLMDVSKITSLGWKPEVSLEQGIWLAFESFKKEYQKKWKTN